MGARPGAVAGAPMELVRGLQAEPHRGFLGGVQKLSRLHGHAVGLQQRAESGVQDTDKLEVNGVNRALGGHAAVSKLSTSTGPNSTSLARR